MTGWVIAGGILLALALLLLLPCSVDAALDCGRLSWQFRLGIIRLPPGKKKKAKPSEKAEAQNKTPKTADISYYKALIDLGAAVLGKLLSAVHIRQLTLHFTAAFDDPYDTTVAYSYAGAAMESFAGICGDKIEHLDLRADLNYDEARPMLYGGITLYARLGKLIQIALFALKGYRRLLRERSTKEREHENGKSTDF